MLFRSQINDDFWTADATTEREKVRELGEKMSTQDLLESFAQTKARILAYEVSLLHYQFKFMNRQKAIDRIIKARQMEDALFDELSRNGYEVLDQLDLFSGDKIYIGDDLPMYQKED